MDIKDKLKEKGYEMAAEVHEEEGVEEFRLKYRNTPEWKILSAHYEDITLKLKH